MWRKLLDWMGFRPAAERAAEPSVDMRLSAIARQRKPGDMAVVGELIVLDLAEARRRVGEKWPLVSRHVHLLVENLLSRRIRGNNVFFRCGEGLFAIIFADRTKDEAELECEAIAQEIMDYLFGAALAGAEDEEIEETVPLAVHSEVFEIELEKLKDAESPSEAIKSLVAERVSARERKHSGEESVVTVLRHVERQLDAISLESNRQREPKLVRQLETLVSRLRALERSLYAARPVEMTGSQEQGEDHVWTPIDPPESPLQRLSALIERTEAELASLTAEAAGERSAEESDENAAEQDVQWLSLPEHKIDFAVDFVPLLDITAGVKGIYLSRIKFRIGGLSYDPRQLVEIEKDKEVLVIADRLTLRSLVQSDSKDEERSGHSIVVVTIHQTTLASLTPRRVYLELASQLSAERRRATFLEVVLDEEWKTSRLPAWLAQLRPYFRGFFLRFPGQSLPLPSDLAALDLAVGRHKGGGAIGLDAEDPALSDEELRLHAMRRLAITANEAGLRTYFLGVRDVRGVTLCRAAAIRYLSCESAMPASGQAGGIEQMSVDDLIARLERMEGMRAQR